MAGFELSEGRLTLSGVLDSDAEGQLRDALRRLLDGGAQVVTVDLSRVEMITSVCVGALVVLWIDLCAAGRQVQFATSPAVKKVLDTTGLTNVLMGDAGGERPEPG